MHKFLLFSCWRKSQDFEFCLQNFSTLFERLWDFKMFLANPSHVYTLTSDYFIYLFLSFLCLFQQRNHVVLTYDNSWLFRFSLSLPLLIKEKKNIEVVATTNIIKKLLKTKKTLRWNRDSHDWLNNNKNQNYQF